MEESGFRKSDEEPHFAYTSPDGDFPLEFRSKTSSFIVMIGHERYRIEYKIHELNKLKRMKNNTKLVYMIIALNYLHGRRYRLGQRCNDSSN